MWTLPSLGVRWVLALAVVGGCRSNHTPSTAASSGPARPVQQARPPLSPKLTLLVEKLAKLDSIDGSSVSDGMPGEFFELWREFSKLAGQSDFERLAEDPRPIVRAMGWLGLAQQPSERNTALILAHLRDREVIRHCPGGCTCFVTPLGGFARELLHDSRHLDSSQIEPMPLLTELQRQAVDLEILATDELAALHFPSARDLAEALGKGKLTLELPYLVGTGRFRKLSPLQVVKAVGRIARAPAAGYQTLGLLMQTLHDRALEPMARLAAASALTRFEDVAAEAAIEGERAFLDSAWREPLCTRFIAEIELRREQTRLMKEIRKADYIHQTEPLADRAMQAFRADHPLVFEDLESTGSFGKHDERVHRARAAALTRIAKRHPEFNQPWNTYADTIYDLHWLINRPHALVMTSEDHVNAVRAAIQSVLPSLHGG